MMKSVQSSRFLAPIAIPRRATVRVQAADEHFEFGYNKIVDKVYFGTCLESAARVDQVKEAGVQLILNVQEASDIENGIDIHGVRARAAEIGGVKHVWAPSPDASTKSLLAGFAKLVAEVDEAQLSPQTGFYTHCFHGSGRGPTFGLAWLFWITGMALTEALDTAKVERPIVRPKVESVQEATKQLLGQDNIDFTKPLSKEQRATILKKLRAMAPVSV